MRHKPDGLELRPVGARQVPVPLPELPDVLVQLFALRVGPDLLDSPVRVEEVRVPLVGHGPVEHAIQLVDVHVEVLRRLHHPVDISGKESSFY